MESIYSEHLHEGYFLGQPMDYPFWQADEPWTPCVEPCSNNNNNNPVFSHPFDDGSPNTAFDTNMTWIDGYETLYHSSPMSPKTTSSPEVPSVLPALTASSSNDSLRSTFTSYSEGPALTASSSQDSLRSDFVSFSERPPLAVSPSRDSVPPLTACSSNESLRSSFNSSSEEASSSQPCPANTADPPPKKSAKPRRKRKQSTVVKVEESSSTAIASSRPKRARRPRSRSVSVSDQGNSLHQGDYLERSRIASNKFRERKRSEIALLESEEYNIEDVNRQLRSTLDDLTSEILSLKMQILQHTNCNCELIQAYISKEAHHFVQSLENVASA